MNKMDVLDNGFVRLVDSMGDDGRIVQAARVSYGDGTKTKREDKALIKYLYENKHIWKYLKMILAVLMIKYLGHGAQKVCFKFGNYVVKFPRLWGHGRGFMLSGILNCFLSFANARVWARYYNEQGKTAKIYFCFLCFFSIEEYCLPINERCFKFIERNQNEFKVIGGSCDFKVENFGYSKIQNNVVWVDFY